MRAKPPVRIRRPITPLELAASITCERVFRKRRDAALSLRQHCICVALDCVSGGLAPSPHKSGSAPTRFGAEVFLKLALLVLEIVRVRRRWPLPRDVWP